MIRNNRVLICGICSRSLGADIASEMLCVVSTLLAFSPGLTPKPSLRVPGRAFAPVRLDGGLFSSDNDQIAPTKLSLAASPYLEWEAGGLRPPVVMSIDMLTSLDTKGGIDFIVPFGYLRERWCGSVQPVSHAAQAQLDDPSSFQ